MDYAKKQVSRRDFVKTAAIAGAAVALASSISTPSLKAFATADGGDPVAAAGEWKPTTCQGCTSWCSKQVFVVAGRAIKVRGNPNSKVNGAASCPRAVMGLQQVYDPDRIKTPMKRTNPNKGKGEDPGFVPTTWDDAINTIAGKISELIEDGDTWRYMLLRGRYSYMRDIIYDRMTKIIGSPNNISHSSICAEAEKFGAYYTEGKWDYRQYDVKNTRYVILWGADPIAANRQVSYYLSAWGDLLDRAQVAVVDPRLSAAAAKASEWLPVKPGGDGALALAMAHVILTEGLWYKEFVGDFDDGINQFKVDPTSELKKGLSVDDTATPFTETHTSGLVKWWNLVLAESSPEAMESASGIPADQVRRVAINFAKAAPAAISWLGGGPSMQPRGGYIAMAVHALNGLVGSTDSVGGIGYGNKEYTRSFPGYSDYQTDAAKAGASSSSHPKVDMRGTLPFPAMAKGKSGGGVVTNNAAKGILERANSDDSIKVCMAYMNNFGFSTPEGKNWEEALATIPFTVHLTTNASEFSWFADIILPSTHHMFEKWGYVKSYANGYRHITLLQPVIDPVWDVKTDETEVPYMIAQKLDSDYNFPNLLEHYNSYFVEGEDTAPTTPIQFALNATKWATKNLWDPDPAANQKGDVFSSWNEFKTVGVWNSGPYLYKARWGNMGTATGKFEFYSETLKVALQKHADKHSKTIDQVLAATNYDVMGEKAFLPHYEEPFMQGAVGTYPLVFVDHKSRFNREGRSANCSWYHEIKDLDPGDVANEDVAKINPEDARKYGISHGDKIKVSSKTGEMECTASVWEGVRPGTLAKAYGQGHWAYGKVAAKVFGSVPRGGNNNDVLPAEYERLSGATAFYAVTRVKVEKI
ncbi:MAG: molybdopterin-dependent oxidoreductase [Chloroflexi bacterium]|jgi:anaerobic selenocysteine-containing dehydrogenase|nr:molybdopterin-dependent oxidoreductase [Chloroflexota bacterium]MBT7082571.1 molybdopterin-dependent oxidoreductase [Chloroflexota bacterium]MBT7289116.1 molybdopterin-dependent oxidoreductase [Chloroflexota bacterium]